ncbi:MAG: hypothetical protein BWY74_01269 [Firmicutes bacterium ADurb.Bin419]|nr:MAG: hypothetical protein BWY74_01269 [Firmicutes bacterium ADurb.Bin419]
MKVKILIFFLVIMLLIGCNSEIPESADTNKNTPTINSDTFEIWKIPSPENGKAIIHGIMVDKKGVKTPGASPFLSRNITSDQPDLPPTISFSTQSDIRAIVNQETGEFYFRDVPPADNYVIVILKGPGQLYVVRQLESEAHLEISIESNQVLDLGKIQVEEP